MYKVLLCNHFSQIYYINGLRIPIHENNQIRIRIQGRRGLRIHPNSGYTLTESIIFLPSLNLNFKDYPWQ